MKVILRTLLMLIALFPIIDGNIYAADLVKKVKSSKLYEYIEDIDNIDKIKFSQSITQFGENSISMTVTFDDDDVIDELINNFIKLNAEISKDILKRFNIRPSIKDIKPIIKATFLFNSSDDIKSSEASLYNHDTFLCNFRDERRYDSNDKFISNLQSHLVSDRYFGNLDKNIAAIFHDAFTKISNERVFTFGSYVVDTITVDYDTGTHLISSYGDKAVNTDNELIINIASLGAEIAEEGKRLYFSPYTYKPSQKLRYGIIYSYSENEVIDFIIETKKKNIYFEYPIKSGLDYPVVLVGAKYIFILLPDKIVYSRNVTGLTRSITGGLELSDEKLAQAYFAWKKQKNKNDNSSEQKDDNEVTGTQTSKDGTGLPHMPSGSSSSTYDIDNSFFAGRALINNLILVSAGDGYELLYITKPMEKMPSEVRANIGTTTLNFSGGPNVWVATLSDSDIKKLMTDGKIIVDSLKVDGEEMTENGLTMASSCNIPLMSDSDSMETRFDLIGIDEVKSTDSGEILIANDSRKFYLSEEAAAILPGLLDIIAEEGAEPNSESVIVFYIDDDGTLTATDFSVPYLVPKK